MISLVGVVWLVSRGAPGTLLTAGLGQGELFMLIASISYAGYNVLLRRWTMPIPSWVSIYVQACCALLFLMPGWLLHESQPLGWGGWALVLYAGILPSIFGPYFWMVGVLRIGPGKMSSYVNLVPVVTAIAAVLLLGEALHGYHLLGGGLTLIGLALAQWAGRSPPLPRQHTARENAA